MNKYINNLEELVLMTEFFKNNAKSNLKARIKEDPSNDVEYSYVFLPKIVVLENLILALKTNQEKANEFVKKIINKDCADVLMEIMKYIINKNYNFHPNEASYKIRMMGRTNEIFITSDEFLDLIINMNFDNL